MSTFTNMTNGLEILLIIRVRTRMRVEEMTDGIQNFIWVRYIGRLVLQGTTERGWLGKKHEYGWGNIFSSQMNLASNFFLCVCYVLTPLFQADSNNKTFFQGSCTCVITQSSYVQHMFEFHQVEKRWHQSHCFIDCTFCMCRNSKLSYSSCYFLEFVCTQ